MALNKENIVSLYRKRAGHYDLASRAYYLIGFRYMTYRRMTVNALQLHPGDVVVDVACGTGLNFPLLWRAVGSSGRIIGVDATDSMLEKAKARVTAAGWENVELVHSDAATFFFPEEVAGILSTLAITLIPEYDEIIRRAAQALGPGKRCAILDFKVPDDKPMWLVHGLVWLTRPFGVSLDLGRRHPWESLEDAFPRHWFTPLFGGFAYLSVGEAE